MKVINTDQPDAHSESICWMNMLYMTYIPYDRRHVMGVCVDLNANALGLHIVNIQGSTRTESEIWKLVF